MSCNKGYLLLAQVLEFNILFWQQQSETLAGSTGRFREVKRDLYPTATLHRHVSFSLEAHTTAAGESEVQYHTSPAHMSTSKR